MLSLSHTKMIHKLRPSSFVESIYRDVNSWISVPIMARLGAWSAEDICPVILQFLPKDTRLIRFIASAHLLKLAHWMPLSANDDVSSHIIGHFSWKLDS